jgi:site-specific recombinase XerD
MTPDGAEELFERLSIRVSFRVRPHMLRHCFGTSLAAAGVAPDVIAELMGHASIVSTEIYLHPDWDRLVAAVVAVGSLGGQSARAGR